MVSTSTHGHSYRLHPFRWLLPVRSLNETERATSVAHEWLMSKHVLTNSFTLSLPTQSTDSSSPFVHHSFPFYMFVPACLSVNATLSSMSMSNRRRLWNIVQQFQVIWRDYRTKGWERGEIFSMFEADEKWSDSEELHPSSVFTLRRHKVP